MKRRSWLWLILGIVLGIALTLAAFKICIDRWFAPGTFELSEENIDRLENLDADAIYRLLSEEDADGVGRSFLTRRLKTADWAISL